MKTNLNAIKFLTTVFLFCCFFFTDNSFGQRTASVSGNWNNTATWGGASVPSVSDAVTINVGVTVTVNITNATCLSMVIGSGNGVATLTFAATGSPVLTVAGNVDVGNSGNQNRDGTITFTSGSTLIANSLRLGTTGNQVGRITMTAGGLLRVNGAITVASTGSIWTPGTGTLEMTANNTLPTTVLTSFNNLTISNNTTTAGVGFSVGGTLTIGSAATLNLNTFAMTGAALTNSGTGTLRTQNTSATPLPTGRTWTGTVEYYGTGAQTVVVGPYTNLTVSGARANNDITFAGATNITGNFTVSATGNAGAQLIMNNSGTVRTFAIGNYSQTGYEVELGSGTAESIINLPGNFSKTGGYLVSTISTLNSVVNFSGTSQNIQSNGGTIVKWINFNVLNGSTCTLNGQFNYDGSSPAGTFTVNSGGTLNCGNFNLVAEPAATAVTFVLSSGGFLNMGSVDGITTTGSTGNIQTDIRTFNVAGNYRYSRGGAQAAGNALPATIGSLTTDNNTILTIATAKIITNNFSIAAGSSANLGTGLSHTAGTLTMGGFGSPSGTHGSTTSAATNTNNTFFAATTGIITVGTGTCAAITAVLSGTNTICNGGSTNLAVAITGGLSTYTVVYSGGTVNAYTSGSNISVNPVTTTVYTLTSVKDTNSCAATVSGTPTVTVIPATVAGGVSGGTTICSGSTSGLLTLSGQTGSVVRWESAVSPFSSWTTIANTTSTYTSGALTQTTQFRAVVQSGSCSILNSAFTTVTIGGSTTWNGSVWSSGAPTSTTAAIIAGNYTSATNGGGFSACTLTVSSGTVIISSGDNVTLNGVLTVSSGSFTLENNANLIQNTDVANSGNIIVKRNTAALMRQDYVMWSAPVAGQQLQTFSPQTLSNRFYAFDGSLGSAGQYVATASTGNFNTGLGYLIRMPNNHPATPTVWSGTFTGVPNNGTQTQSSLTAGRYYAVGNPYPSTIFADDFINDNNLTEAIYFWRKTNNAATSSYATYTLAGGVSNSGGDPLLMIPNGFIQVGQGFIARVPAGESTLEFTNTMRINNNGDQFFRRLFERSRYWLNLTDNLGFFGQTMVAYMTGATNGYDPAIDGLFFGDSQTALTSIVDNQEYIIQGRALPFETTDAITLGFKSELGGNYTIALNSFDGLFETDNQDIYLKDNLTTALTNLKTNSYSFASTAGVFNNRFEIVYENLLSVETPIEIADKIIVYKQNQEVVINSGTVIMNKVQFYDVRGRLLIEKDQLQTTEFRINAGEANQVLILKITIKDGEIVTKRILN
jgi:hypothetical protein